MEIPNHNKEHSAELPVRPHPCKLLPWAGASRSSWPWRCASSLANLTRKHPTVTSKAIYRVAATVVPFGGRAVGVKAGARICYLLNKRVVYTILYYTVWYYAIYYTILHYIVLCYIILYYTI